MNNLQHPTQGRKSAHSSLAVRPLTAKVPTAILIDYLIDHLLVGHILVEQPANVRPDRILELLADHLVDLHLKHEIGIPVEETLDHLLEHLFKVEIAMEDAEEWEAEA